jgi:hypothetical protein
MQNEHKLLFAIDVLTTALIFLVCLAVFFPIWSVTNSYPFYGTNVLFIAVFCVGLRYIFGLNYSFLAERQEWKIGVMLLMVPAVFLLISTFTGVMAHIEDQTFMPITGHLPEPDRIWTDQFIWGEMVFFGIGSILTCFVLPIRLFRSIWKQRNARTGKKKNVFLDEDEY